jgi:hypothetical protein
MCPKASRLSDVFRDSGNCQWLRHICMNSKRWLSPWTRMKCRRMWWNKTHYIALFRDVIIAGFSASLKINIISASRSSVCPPFEWLHHHVETWNQDIIMISEWRRTSLWHLLSFIQTWIRHRAKALTCGGSYFDIQWPGNLNSWWSNGFILCNKRGFLGFAFAVLTRVTNQWTLNG